MGKGVEVAAVTGIHVYMYQQSNWINHDVNLCCFYFLCFFLSHQVYIPC